MGETLGRRENMASPGTRGKLVGVVLSEAEYITIQYILSGLPPHTYHCASVRSANSSISRGESAIQKFKKKGIIDKERNVCQKDL